MKDIQALRPFPPLTRQTLAPFFLHLTSHSRSQCWKKENGRQRQAMSGVVFLQKNTATTPTAQFQKCVLDVCNTVLVLRSISYRSTEIMASL